MSQVLEAIHDVSGNQGLLNRTIAGCNERVQAYELVVPVDAPPAAIAFLRLELAAGAPIPDYP